MKSFQVILSASLLLASVACGGRGDGDNVDAKPAVESPAAERVDSSGHVSYRPDSMQVFQAVPQSQDSTFIVISKYELRLYVMQAIGGDTTVLARFPVCLSRNKGPKQKSGDMRTPETQSGQPFVIQEIVPASDWEHDFGDGRGKIRAYGNWFMRLKTPFSGIGIHGSTNNEDKMPGRDSEGCIRLRDADLDYLKEHYAYVGMPVYIENEQGERQVNR